MLRKICAATMALVALSAAALWAEPAVARERSEITDVSARRHHRLYKRHAWHRGTRHVKRSRSARVKKAFVAKPAKLVASTPYCMANEIIWTAMTKVPLTLAPIIRPFGAEEMDPYRLALIDEVADARAYLVRTASPGETMSRQGTEVAIGRLNPEFAVRLARAIREARANGLPKVGIFSAYRPPIYGIGGMRDKAASWHAYGGAVDVAGIGSAGSSSSLKWYAIAGRNKIFNPYGPFNRAEHNHYQLGMTLAVSPGMELRRTITARGPIDLSRMWKVASNFMRNVVWSGAVPTARYAHRHYTRYASHGHRHFARRHLRVRYAGAA